MTYLVTITNWAKTKSEVYTITNTLGLPHAEHWAHATASKRSSHDSGKPKEVWWVNSIVNPNDKSDYVFRSHPDRIPPIAVISCEKVARG